jgi:hypothetical protein
MRVSVDLCVGTTISQGVADGLAKLDVIPWSPFKLIASMMSG